LTASLGNRVLVLPAHLVGALIEMLPLTLDLLNQPVHSVVLLARNRSFKALVPHKLPATLTTTTTHTAVVLLVLELLNPPALHSRGVLFTPTRQVPLGLPVMEKVDKVGRGTPNLLAPSVLDLLSHLLGLVASGAFPEFRVQGIV
jgi:hypothetical protein